MRGRRRGQGPRAPTGPRSWPGSQLTRCLNKSPPGIKRVIPSDCGQLPAACRHRRPGVIDSLLATCPNEAIPPSLPPAPAPGPPQGGIYSIWPRASPSLPPYHHSHFSIQFNMKKTKAQDLFLSSQSGTISTYFIGSFHNKKV